MDEGSDSRFAHIVRQLFRLSDPPLEEHILDAKVEGEIKSDEASLLLNVLKLEDKLVEDVMVPRPDIDCAEETQPVRQIASLIIATGHSRIPIYRETRDNMIGIVHAKDLMRPLMENGDSDFDLSSVLRTPIMVSEKEHLYGLLRHFQGARSHLAIVLDEYGGTAGLVTLEDVLEEIVGDIQDEHDTEEPSDILRKRDGTWMVTGRAELNELAEQTGILLDSEHVDTLSGYLSQLSGRIPQEGEYFVIGGKRYTVIEADARQVKLVSIASVEPEEAPAEDSDEQA